MCSPLFVATNHYSRHCQQSPVGISLQPLLQCNMVPKCRLASHEELSDQVQTIQKVTSLLTRFLSKTFRALCKEYPIYRGLKFLLWHPHWAAHNCLKLQLQGISQSSSGFCGCLHTCTNLHTDTYTQTLIHKGSSSSYIVNHTKIFMTNKKISF